MIDKTWLDSLVHSLEVHVSRELRRLHRRNWAICCYPEGIRKGSRGMGCGRLGGTYQQPTSHVPAPSRHPWVAITHTRGRAGHPVARAGGQADAGSVVPGHVPQRSAVQFIPQQTPVGRVMVHSGDEAAVVRRFEHVDRFVGDDVPQALRRR